MNVEKKIIFHLKKALLYLPDYPEALLKLCNIYFDNNLSNKVEKLLDNYNKRNQTVEYIEALISINKGYYDEASSKLAKIITENSELTIYSVLNGNKKNYRNKNFRIYLFGIIVIVNCKE